MRTVGTVVLAAMVLTGSAFAQGPGQGHGRGKPHGPGGPQLGRDRQGAVISRIIQNEKMIEKLGLTEEQVLKLKNHDFQTQKSKIQLQAQMQMAALEQAQLLTETDMNRKAIMAAVEKTGQIRTKMAKLGMKTLLVMKETLTDEQRKQLRKMVAQHRKQRGPGGQGNKRPQGNKGRPDGGRQGGRGPGRNPECDRPGPPTPAGE